MSAMPEMYEISRICDYLKENQLLNILIKSVTVSEKGHNILKNSTAKEFQKFLVGNKIIKISQHAKFIIFRMNQGILLIHLRFTGLPKLRGIPIDNNVVPIHNLPVFEKDSDQIRLSIHFENQKILDYFDTRRLSHIKIYPNLNSVSEIPELKKMAPDLDQFSPFSTKDFQIFKEKNMDIKVFLLDQRFSPSGIGNFLACEILFDAKLNPWKKLSELTQREISALNLGIKTVKEKAKNSVSYEWLNVYKRSECSICKSKIERKNHTQTRSSRSTYFCPTCQSNRFLG